ncbi:type I restriction enzyme HsdR N-terminal domain-containing protein [Ancylomarina sp. 16SWW S1-10-2]|uniref:type I restriction enzyme HsdR N-terminal domain-containing protein n=1 Tax=Ancylomarina sp. 16SWW S1-10-2 TaxID=2499681 RepID=UPI0012AD2793|nr:type I restriction enzyme HsdR N-terminal domain-containing protein [Ancylomarina sp. 16SWW S1-10-2]MRT91894.1 type I restriction enzyme HsdR N-terminal domain-containing protein [Ancylomarina sp. 16SWW S1-10-2]
MEKLNLPSYNFNIKLEEQRKLIFDSIRKKYVVLTPEEWVRQNFISYLVENKNYPKGLIAVEKKVDVNRMPQRSDIVLYNNKAIPVMIVECKASCVKISQDTFNQIARYNMKLQVPYLVVTNGLKHYCCEINYETNSFHFIPEIPDYKKIL